MVKHFLLLFLTCTFGLSAFAQSDSVLIPPRPHQSHLRISLVTCGPGDEFVWETFGHTAVRVVDSDYHLDLVYNYGTFGGYESNFELQFMRGKVLYSLSVAEFDSFIPEYVRGKRSVSEQILLIDEKSKEEIYHFLNWNAKPENRNYKYDFFFDNCATRIRDVFQKILGRSFSYGATLPAGSHLTFRDIMNRYFYRDHWTRLGVNLLLGSKIDKPMTSSDIMFLPDYLRDGLAGARLNNLKVASDSIPILPGAPSAPAAPNQPFILLCLVAILTIAGLTAPKLKKLGRIMSTLVLFVTGLLGCIILVMWFATDHQGCSNNFNLLWCLPLNIVIAFFNPKGKGRYALIAIMLLLTSVVLHLAKVQGLTLLELSPLFLSLLFIYGAAFRRSQPKTV